MIIIVRALWLIKIYKQKLSAISFWSSIPAVFHAGDADDVYAWAFFLFSVDFTVGQNSQESGREYWATHSFFCSFARTTRSFACFALLALLALIHSLARTFTPKLMGKWLIRCLIMTWFCPTVLFPSISAEFLFYFLVSHFFLVFASAVIFTKFSFFHYLVWDDFFRNVAHLQCHSCTLSHKTSHKKSSAIWFLSRATRPTLCLLVARLVTLLLLV